MHGMNGSPGTAEEDKRHHDQHGELCHLKNTFGDGRDEQADPRTYWENEKRTSQNVLKMVGDSCTQNITVVVKSGIKFK